MIADLESWLFDHPSLVGCPYSPVSGRMIAPAGWLGQMEQRVY